MKLNPGAQFENYYWIGPSAEILAVKQLFCTMVKYNSAVTVLGELTSVLVGGMVKLVNL